MAVCRVCVSRTSLLLLRFSCARCDVCRLRRSARQPRAGCQPHRRHGQQRRDIARLRAVTPCSRAGKEGDRHDQRCFGRCHWLVPPTRLRLRRSPLLQPQLRLLLALLARSTLPGRRRAGCKQVQPESAHSSHLTAAHSSRPTTPPRPSVLSPQRTSHLDRLWRVPRCHAPAASAVCAIAHCSARCCCPLARTGWAARPLIRRNSAVNNVSRISAPSSHRKLPRHRSSQRFPLTARRTRPSLSVLPVCVCLCAVPLEEAIARSAPLTHSLALDSVPRARLRLLSACPSAALPRRSFRR